MATIDQTPIALQTILPPPWMVGVEIYFDILTIIKLIIYVSRNSLLNDNQKYPELYSESIGYQISNLINQFDFSESKGGFDYLPLQTLSARRQARLISKFNISWRILQNPMKLSDLHLI